MPRSAARRQLAVQYDTYLIIGPCICDLPAASRFSKYYIVKKEIPDLSTQQQGTESILVNSESLLFADLCYGF